MKRPPNGSQRQYAHEYQGNQGCWFQILDWMYSPRPFGGRHGLRGNRMTFEGNVHINLYVFEDIQLKFITSQAVLRPLWKQHMHIQVIKFNQFEYVTFNITPIFIALSLASLYGHCPLVTFGGVVTYRSVRSRALLLSLSLNVILMNIIGRKGLGLFHLLHRLRNRPSGTCCIKLFEVV